MSFFNSILCLFLGFGSGLLLACWLPEMFCGRPLCVKTQTLSKRVAVPETRQELFDLIQKKEPL